MTNIPWQNGNILTAGSLRLIPQYYGWVSGTTPTATLSPTYNGVTVSGNSFGEFLLVQFSCGALTNSTNCMSNVILQTSGPGIAGSTVFKGTGVLAVPDNNQSGAAHFSTTFQIGSNMGWIPGSAVQLNVIISGLGTNQVTYFGGMTVYGTGLI